MESEYIEINQAGSEFDNSPCGFHLSNCMNSVFLWKLVQADEDYPEEGKSSLYSIVNKFIIDFFRVNRGEDEDLKILTRELIRTLRKFIRNVKIDDEKFLKYMINEFSLFHSEIIDFQRDKALEIVNSIRGTFKLNSKAKKMFLYELNLDHEIGVFMTKITGMNSLNFNTFYDLFISTFKNFFPDYNDNVKDTIRDYIEKSINDFNHKFERSLAKTKNQLYSYLLDIIQSIKPARLTVFMKEVSNDFESSGSWMVSFEMMIDKEQVELKQIVYLNENSLIITIAFKESNRLMVVFSDQHVISFCDHDLMDSDTLICEGSSKENLIFIHNTLRKAFIAIEADSRLEATTELKSFFSEPMRGITSALFLKQAKEIISVDDENNLSIFSLESKVLSKTSEIVPTKYRKVGLSSCGNFIYLISLTEVYVFTSKCEQVILDYRPPDLACLTKHSLIMCQIEPNESFSFRILLIDKDYVAEKNIRTSLTENIEYQVRNTVSFGRELIEGLMKKSHFNKFSPPEINPK